MDEASPHISGSQALQVRFGDTLVLGVDGANGWCVGTDDGSLVLELLDPSVQGLPHVSHSIFTVHTRCQYAAMLALHEQTSFYNQHSHSASARLDEPAQQFSVAKEQARLQELQYNKELFHRNIGEALVYGEVLQLQHVATASFVTARKQRALVERNNFSVVLDANGDEGSWFVILPAHNVKGVGDKVNYGDIVNVVSAKYTNIGLHVSLQPVAMEAHQPHPYIRDVREVNGAEQVTHLSLTFASEHRTSAQLKSILFGGDVVMLCHKASNSILVCEDKVVHFTHPPQEGCSSTSLWIVQSTGVEGSTTAVKRVQLVRFKHYASELYLEITAPTDTGSTQQDSRSSHMLGVQVTELYDSLSTLWRLHIFADDADDCVPVPSTIYMQSYEARGWLSEEVAFSSVTLTSDRPDHSGSDHNLRQHVFDSISSDRSTATSSDTLHGVSIAPYRSERDALELTKPDAQYLSQLATVLHAQRKLAKFIQDFHQCVKPLTASDDAAGILEIIQQDQDVSAVLQVHADVVEVQLLNIVHLLDIPEHLVQYGKYHVQAMMYEQKLCDTILTVLVVIFLKKCFPAACVDSTSIELQYTATRLSSVCTMCLQVLRLAVAAFPPAQAKLARARHVFFKLLGSEQLADVTIDVLYATFHGNSELLGTLRMEDLETLTNGLRVHHRHRCVSLLEGLCSVDGAPVPSIQNMLVDLLLRPGVLLQITVQDDGPHTQTVRIAGPDGLQYDCRQTNIEDDNAVLEGSWEESQSVRNIHGSAGEKYCRYLLASLQLLCALCAGRNGKVCSVLVANAESLCISDYQLLVMAFMPGLPMLLRAACCRLFCRLYVQQEPFCVVSPISRTRVWGFTEQVLADNSLQAVNPHINSFKKAATEFLKDTQGCFSLNSMSRNVFVLAVLEALQLLVTFGLFDSPHPPSPSTLSLISLLISLLSGANDLVPAGRSMFEKAPDTLIVMRCKTTICEVLMYFLECHENQLLTEVYQAFCSMRNSTKPHASLGKRFSKSVSERWSVRHLKILLDDASIARPETFPKESFRALEKELFAECHSATGQQQLLSSHRRSQLTNILLSLTRYEYTPLQAISWRLVERLLGQREAVVYDVLGTQLLVYPDVIQAHRQAIQDLRLLHNQQKWLASDEEQRGQEAQMACKQVCERLCALLELENGSSAGDHKHAEVQPTIEHAPALETVHRNQAMLYNLDIVQAILEVLKLPIKRIRPDTSLDVDETSPGLITRARALEAVGELGLRDLLQAAYTFLGQLCCPILRADHPLPWRLLLGSNVASEYSLHAASQHDVAHNVGAYFPHLMLDGVCPAAAHAVAMSIMGNAATCGALEQDVVRRIFRCVLQYRRCSLMKILIVAVSTRVQKLKEWVSRLASDYQEEALNLCKTPAEVARRFRKMKDNEHDVAGDVSELRYHTLSVTLIALCCQGSPRPETVHQASELVSWSDCMASLLDQRGGTRPSSEHNSNDNTSNRPTNAAATTLRFVKMPYMLILHYVYVQAESSKGNVDVRSSHNRLWPGVNRSGNSLMQDVLIDLKDAVDEANSADLTHWQPHHVGEEGSALDYIIWAVLPMLTCYMRNHCPPVSTMTAAQVSALQALKSTCEDLYTALPAGVERSAVEAFLSSLQQQHINLIDANRTWHRIPSQALQRLDTQPPAEEELIMMDWAMFTRAFAQALGVDVSSDVVEGRSRRVYRKLLGGGAAGQQGEGGVVRQLVQMMCQPGALEHVQPQLLRADIVSHLAFMLATSADSALPPDSAIRLLKVLIGLLFVTDVDGVISTDEFDKRYHELGVTKCAATLVSHPQPSIAAEATVLLMLLTDNGTEAITTVALEALSSNAKFLNTEASTTARKQIKILQRIRQERVLQALQVSLPKSQSQNSFMNTEREKSVWSGGNSSLRSSGFTTLLRTATAQLRRSFARRASLGFRRHRHMTHDESEVPNVQHVLRMLQSFYKRQSSGAPRLLLTPSGTQELLLYLVRYLEALQPGIEDSMGLGDGNISIAAVQVCKTITALMSGPTLDNQVLVARSNFLQLSLWIFRNQRYEPMLPSSETHIPTQQQIHSTTDPHGTHIARAQSLKGGPAVNNFKCLLKQAISDSWLALLEELPYIQTEIPAKLLDILDFELVLENAQVIVDLIHDARSFLVRSGLVGSDSAAAITGLLNRSAWPAMYQSFSGQDIELRLRREAMSCLLLLQRLDDIETVQSRYRVGHVRVVFLAGPRCTHASGCLKVQRKGTLCLAHALDKHETSKAFFDKHRGTVEVLHNGQVQLVRFQLPDDLHRAHNSRGIHTILKSLQKHRSVQTPSQHATLLMQQLRLEYILAVPFFISLCLLLVLTLWYGDGFNNWRNTGAPYIVFHVFAWLQVLATWTTLVLYTLAEGPVFVYEHEGRHTRPDEIEQRSVKKKAQQQEQPHEAEQTDLVGVLRHLDRPFDFVFRLVRRWFRGLSEYIRQELLAFIYYGAMFIAAILGIFWDPFFFALHLLFWVFNQPRAFVVLRGLRVAAKELLKLGLLGLIVMYLFAVRASKAARRDDLKQRCFVCRLPCKVFEDLQPGGFETHIADEHNPLMYLYYLLYVGKKDPSERTGLEAFVARQLSQCGTEWLPVARSHAVDAHTLATRITRNSTLVVDGGNDLSSLASAIRTLQQRFSRLEAALIQNP
eukprot:jgi/Chlat1/395/Chrsp10S00053